MAALRPADAVLVEVNARAGIDRVQGATVRRTRRRHGRAGRRTERGRTARRGRGVGGEAPSAVVDVAVQILHLLEEAHGSRTVIASCVAAIGLLWLTPSIRMPHRRYEGRRACVHAGVPGGICPG